jgi:hypothetical protein
MHTLRACVNQSAPAIRACLRIDKRGAITRRGSGLAFGVRLGQLESNARGVEGPGTGAAGGGGGGASILAVCAKCVQGRRRQTVSRSRDVRRLLFLEECRNPVRRLFGRGGVGVRERILTRLHPGTSPGCRHGIRKHRDEPHFKEIYSRSAEQRTCMSPSE